MNHNHWITFDKDIIARWGAFLPAPHGDVSCLVEFAHRLAEAGAHEDVYRIVRLPGSTPFDANVGKSFRDHLLDIAAQTGRLPLWPAEARPGPEGTLTPARLAFFDGERIAEEQVDDAGALLRRLRPEDARPQRMFMRSVSPLTVLGGFVPVAYDREVRVQIRLDTDIWFPKVMGLLDDPPEEGDRPDSVDNAALAQRHTPRLNRFLRAVREATLELGGRWGQLETDGLGMNYADLCREDGIALDV
jgi:hypothetical protein